MVRKKSNSSRVPAFFAPPDPHDPLGNIVAAGMNIVVGHGLTRLSREAARLMGLSSSSIEDEIALNRSRLQLERQEADTARVKALSEMQVRMLDLKIEEKEAAIQEKKRRLEASIEERSRLAIPMHTTVVEGALEIPINPGGISSPGDSEELEGYQEWLDSLAEGKVILVLGRRGSGKTALGGRIAEFVSATYGMPIFWVGLPVEARSLLPYWVKLADSPEQCPAGSVILADEAGLRFASLSFATDQNKLLRSLLMISRHKHCSLIFATQSSRDAENSIIRMADTFIFKQPGFHQPGSERADVKPMAKKAAQVFEGIPEEKRLSVALVFDDAFEGIIATTVPSFWSEELSHIYRHVDLAQLETQVIRHKELEQEVAEETKLLNVDSLDRDILELRQQGYGIETIAKKLGCTTWRVRKCLNR
jgi:energy-coupling factor transporter ATP-binding protein EcfA2